MSVNEHRNINIGTSDYATKSIQPWDIWKEYKLNPWDADIVKRVLRTKSIEGKSKDEMRAEDYEKIIHVCQERLSHFTYDENKQLKDNC